MEVAHMPKNIIHDVRTKPIGFAPILAHYFKKCDIADIIDTHVPTDPRRKVLTHGEACIAMITGILFQVMQLYRICQFARESTVLDALLLVSPLRRILTTAWPILWMNCMISDWAIWKP